MNELDTHSWVPQEKVPQLKAAGFSSPVAGSRRFRRRSERKSSVSFDRGRSQWEGKGQEMMTASEHSRVLTPALLQPLPSPSAHCSRVLLAMYSAMTAILCVVVVLGAGEVVVSRSRSRLRLRLRS